MNAPAHPRTSQILSPTEAGIAQATALLQNDGIVALPTETVYGLAGKAYNSLVIKKIYTAKRRPAQNPLIWHVHSQEKALSLFAFSSMSITNKNRLERLAACFWPGPLTMVGPKAPSIESALPTIAVRIPKTPVTLEILRRCDFPLAMPSANLSTRPSPTNASHVLKTLNGRIDAIMDGGECDGGLESTVIFLDESGVKILRPGLIELAALEQILQEKVIYALEQSGPLSSPGQAFLHYAPEVHQIALLSPDAAAVHWPSLATFIAQKSVIDELVRHRGARPTSAMTLALEDRPAGFAKQLYGALYAAEAHKERALVLVSPPHGEAWAAIIDRLSRAAGKLSKNAELI